ncbi:unnamed protein product [Heterobilharzia americana]|nr:unnamed protein product [Heterobilharzia americana]
MEVSLLPTSCLALSSCGGNLRLWPRLTRNYVHVDTVLPAPIGGLYGDQAIHLEPIHVAGAFLVSTRTGHLLLIDTRNAQDGVNTRLLTSTNDGCLHTQGLLSGLGRRVSSFFSLVSSTPSTGPGKFIPARGGENFVFLRLITCVPSSDSDKCLCFALYKSQLDVWSIDQNLNYELVGAYTIESLVDSSFKDDDLNWQAVDFAIQSNRYAPATDEILAYIIISRADDHLLPKELRLLTVKFNQIESSLCFTINATVSVEYPFYENRLSTTDERDIQFCLPTDLAPQSLYPCLLGCLYSLRAGQVIIIEVLTGQSIGRLQFSPNSPNQPPNPKSLIAIGNSDIHNLFVFLTCQCGLLSLTPCMDIQVGSSVGNNSMNEVLGILPPSSGSIIDGDQVSLTGSEVSLNRNMNKSRSSIASYTTASSQKQHHTEPDFSIIVHTTDDKRLRVNVMFTMNTYIISSVGESPDKPIKIHPIDRLFVALSEVARVFWMGFKEQTANYLKCLFHDTSVKEHLSVVYFRLAKRILNEHPVSDARWQWLNTQLTALVNSIPVSNLDYLESEGSYGFQYIVPAIHNNSNHHGSTDTLLLPVSRLCARLDALQNLKDLWLLMYNLSCEQSSCLGVKIVSSVKLTDLPKHLNILIYSSLDSEDDTEINCNVYLKMKTSQENMKNAKFYHEVRSLMNEQSFTTNIDSCHSNDDDGDDNDIDAADEIQTVMNTFPNSKYACCSPDYDQLVEDCASRLLKSLDFDNIIKAADDCPMDDGLDWAETHVLCGLHMAGEITEFAKALQNKLAKEPQSLYQSVFNEVAMNAGFTSSYLQVIKSQDAALQTVTLIPQLIKRFCEVIDTQMSLATVVLSDEIHELSINMNRKLDSLTNRNSVEFLVHVSRLIEAGVAEIVRYREIHLPILLKTIESYSQIDQSSRKVYYLPCWLTDEEPYGLGNILLKLLNHLVKVGSNKLVLETESGNNSEQTTSNHQLITDSTKYAIDLIHSILSIAKQRVFWATINSSWALSSNKETLQDNRQTQRDIKNRIQAIQRLRRLKHWYASLREYLISIVGDQLHRPESALDLAEQFVDRDQIMRWCYLLEVQDEQYSLSTGDTGTSSGGELSSVNLLNETDQRNRFHHHRLAVILKRVSPEWKLPDYALQWFLSHGERSRVQSLLALLHRSTSSLNRTLNSTDVYVTNLIMNNSNMNIIQPQIANSSIVNESNKSNSLLMNTHHQFQSRIDANMNHSTSMIGATPVINDSTQHKIGILNDNHSDPVEKFLHRKDVQNYAWPHLMSTEQYEKAANILFEEGCKEFQYLGRRKTLFSLAKLTYLASNHSNSTINMNVSLSTLDMNHRVHNPYNINNNNNTDHNTSHMGFSQNRGRYEKGHSFLSKIDSYLDWISFQELIDSNHIKSESIFETTSSDSNLRFKRVLSIPVLVRLFVNYAVCLNETVKSNDDDEEEEEDNNDAKQQLLPEMIIHFRRAFMLVDILQNLLDLRPNEDCQHPTEVRDELLLHIWCQAIRMNEWSTSGEIHDPVEICTRSFICALVSDLYKSGVDVISLLPSPEQLLAADELADLVKDPQFHYLIESGFEHMRNLLTTPKCTLDTVKTDVCV